MSTLQKPQPEGQSPERTSVPESTPRAPALIESDAPPQRPDGKQISEVNSLHPSSTLTDDTDTWSDDAGAGSTTSNWPEKKTDA